MHISYHSASRWEAKWLVETGGAGGAPPRVSILEQQDCGPGVARELVFSREARNPEFF